MKVASTPTILDKQKERLAISLEINHMKAEKELVRRDLDELQSARDALRKELGSKIGVEDLKNAVLENIINNRLKYNIDKYEKDLERLSTEKDIREDSLKKTKIELQKVKENFERKSKDFERLKKEDREFREQHNLFIEKSTAEAERLSSKLKELRTENKAEEHKAEEFKADYLQKKTFLAEEEIRLANKGSDLHIYEARLRKKYLELWPEMEIVI